MRNFYDYIDEDASGHLGDLSLWRRMIGFMRDQQKWVATAVLLSFLITITGLVLPYLIQIALDRYILDESLEMEARLQGVVDLSLLFVLVVLLGFVANFFQVTVLERAGQRMMHSIRRDLFHHVLRLNLSFFHSQRVGRLTTWLTNDVQNLHEMFTSVIVTLFNEGVRLVGIIAILLWLHWRLALLLSVILPVMLWITVWFGRLSREAFRRIRQHLATINGFIQETVSGISMLQLFQQEKQTYRRFTDLNEEYYRAALYQIRVFGVFVPLIEVMNSLSLVLIIVYGGMEILRGRMTIGVLAAFIAYMRLFFQPLRELSQKYSVVQSAMASAEKIFQLLDTKDFLPSSSNLTKIETVRGKIEFKNVVFGYEPERPVIHGVSFEVEPGETLAIIGATGSGKSTLIYLLERFHDPWEGAIELDGTDLRHLDVKWLREQIGLVMQDIFIVPGTVRENILLDSEVSDAELEKIVGLSQLGPWVKQLPQGLETRIGEGGMDLSAGQKQLLSFARVLLRNPRILVLDEATANVDPETEMLIEQAIQAVLVDRTNIIIAHRLSTIKRADCILMMDDGRIVEQGTHETLLATGGLYYHLQTL